jgi:integrase
MAAKQQRYGANDVFKLPDGGIDPKGRRKQKCYTLGEGMQLMVCGDSRLYYSPWLVPKELLAEGVDKKVKREPLGSANTITYIAALSAHLEIRKDIKKGKYPETASTKGAGRRPKAETFEAYATRVVEGWAAKRKNAKDAFGMRRIIPAYCAKINPLGIDNVGTTHVLDVLRPIWDDKPAMAEEVRALIARVLKAAATEGLRPAGDPANGDSIRAVLGKQKKKRGQIRGPMKHVPPHQMPQFMVELRRTKSQTPRALEALILSNLRTNAVRFLHIDHLDFADGSDPLRPGAKWSVPGGPDGLMKVDDDGHDFVLPMSAPLVAVLKQQIDYLEQTFPGQPVGLLWPGVDRDTGKVTFDRPISENTMRDWLVHTMGYEATPHGLRATFQTWAENELMEDGETAKFNPDAIGYCMAHNPGDKVKRAYRRNKLWRPRVGIMSAWARHLSPPRTKLKVVA